MTQTTLWYLLGTGFPFLMTALGAAAVFFFRKQVCVQQIQKIFLGFAAGVMIAASVWSLLIPAMEQAARIDQKEWLPAAERFLLQDCVFDVAGQPDSSSAPADKATGGRIGFAGGSKHHADDGAFFFNIPEGMAVGLAFALAAQQENLVGYSAALALAIGMGIQNFPEGAAISLAPRRGRLSPLKKLCLWRAVRSGGADFRDRGGCSCGADSAADAVDALLCGGRNDVCCGGRTDSRSKAGGTFQCRYAGSNGRIFTDDGAGCCARIGR